MPANNQNNTPPAADSVKANDGADTVVAPVKDDVVVEDKAVKGGTKHPRHYVLKEGMEHSYIENGELVEVRGDGKLTIPLTDAQAENFSDKLVSLEGSKEPIVSGLSRSFGGFVATNEEDALKASNSGNKEVKAATEEGQKEGDNKKQPGADAARASEDKA